ncbi:hypothetical protein ACGFJ7_27635 [Actinoplanes sp. NPDC048988]|uniref:hypothetical protein n=1 Tax=Actinoplanes sp. NPDC048988 TaxID=3363901 RepID=UPI00371A0D8F
MLAAGTAGEVEIDNDIVSGRGLGVNSVTRPRDPNDGFSTMLIWIEARASQWWVDHPGRSGPELVAQWLRMRSNAFAFHGADTVFGELDSGFIDVVRGYPGRPDGCQWYQSGLSSDEAYAFAADRFATRADNSFLSLGDYFADVDAWVIGQQSRLDPAIPLSTLFRRQYATRDTAANRFGGFFARRFGLNADRARVCAANMFDQPGDAKTAGIRNAFWWDQFVTCWHPPPCWCPGPPGPAWRARSPIWSSSSRAPHEWMVPPGDGRPGVCPRHHGSGGGGRRARAGGRLSPVVVPSP